MPPADPQLLVARIGKPHGLRGEVTVQVHTDDPERRFVVGATFATEAAPGSSAIARAWRQALTRLSPCEGFIARDDDARGVRGRAGPAIGERRCRVDAVHAERD